MSDKKSFFAVFGLASCLMLAQPSQASNYNFNVKIINNSGQEINLWSVRFKSKGRGFRACNDDNLMIAAGETTMRPFCPANAQLWQRQIRLVFACLDSQARRDLNFPRGSNRFYARDHAKTNGDKYVVRIRESDC